MQVDLNDRQKEGARATNVWPNDRGYFCRQKEKQVRVASCVAFRLC